MLDEAKKLQNNAVKNIISLLPYKKEIVFKAPTGSGKTHMMADLMNQVLENNQDVVFLVSSLSKGNLAEQNYEKFCEYLEKKEFTNINPYLISSEKGGEGRLVIPSDYNVYILPTDLFKENSILHRGALLNFLNLLTIQKPLGKEKEIYLIKDESHIETKNLNSLSNLYFTKILNFTATPNLKRGQMPDVQIREEEAINAKLIKEVEYCDEEETLQDAINKFEIVKNKYLEEFKINPCLIIQISNAAKADKEIEEIMQVLNNKKDLQWMFIFDKNNSTKCKTNHRIGKTTSNINEWKKLAKANDSTIDVIIFKQVITEGWDIPRACMLYQIRDTKSEQLKEQVLGRIRRNPMLLNFEKLTDNQKMLATKAYVWGNKAKEDNMIQEVKLYGNYDNNEIENEIRLKTTVLKDFANINNIDIDDIICNTRKKVNSQSIFSLYKKYNRASNDIQSLCRNYTCSVKKWIDFMENIDEIKNKRNEYATEYSLSMEIAKDEQGKEIEVSFPLISYYTENTNFKKISINNWVWQKTNGNDKFSFDSEAETKWAMILLNLMNKSVPNSNDKVVKDITIEDEKNNDKYYMIGKNYLLNSKIKYEYYLNGVHSSYPDFIMKDYLGRIHIFETKSINKSNSINFDEDDYEDKINELKECYKEASKLTGYYFYIPVLEGEKWQIHVMYSGNIETISKETFEERLLKIN